MTLTPAQFQPSLSLLPQGSGERAKSARESFSSVLARSRPDATRTPEQAAREGAEQFVAIALIQPILKQLREANNAARPFAPSSGEKQFQSLFDSQVARQLAAATHFPVVDRIAHDLLKRGRVTPPKPSGPDTNDVRLNAGPSVQPKAAAWQPTSEADHAPSQTQDSPAGRFRPAPGQEPGDSRGGA